MTKFETIIRLVELKSALNPILLQEVLAVKKGIAELINDLSKEFIEPESHEECCEHECPAYEGETHLYARNVCVGCGHSHE